jgi:hypothetical protein
MRFLSLIAAKRKHDQAIARHMHRIYCANKIQALFRGHKGRKAAMRLKKIKLRKMINDKAIIVQSVVRCLLAKKKFKLMKAHNNRVINLKIKEKAEHIYKACYNNATL